MISLFYILAETALGPRRMIERYLPGMALSYHYSCLLLWALFMVGFVLMAFNRKITLSIIRQTGLIWLLIGLAFLSTLWSSWKGGTLQYSLALAGTTGSAILISLRFRAAQQLQMLALTIAAIALSSLFLAVIHPAAGVMDGVHEGAWKGIFLHKNHLGKIMALGVLVFLFVPIHGKTHPFLSGGGALLCAFLLLKSRSRNSLFALSLCVLTYLFVTRFRHSFRNIRQSPLAWVCLFAGISAAFWIYWDLEWIFQLISRDETLAARADIWKAVIEKIKLHPWMGYGYGVFWQGGNTGVSGEVTREIGWYPDHAHNGFLDLVLDLGLVGLSLFFIFFLPIFIRVYQNALKSLSQTARDYWPAVFLLFFICYNLLETDLFRHNSLMWLLSVVVIANLLTESKRIRHTPG